MFESNGREVYACREITNKVAGSIEARWDNSTIEK